MAHRTASAAEIRAAVGITVTQRTVRNRLLQGQLRARRLVACIPLTQSRYHIRSQWCQDIAHRMKASSALVPLMARVFVRMRSEELSVAFTSKPTPGVMVWEKNSYMIAGTLSWLSQTY
ncbi:allene oxide synthase-lipoxygenase protein [Trichonephila clavipes]|nr:allene oxide synthase-lipoxygenase protein [Trichonephila clavipes]